MDRMEYSELTFPNDLNYWQSFFDSVNSRTYIHSAKFEYYKSVDNYLVKAFVGSNNGENIAAIHYTLKQHFNGIFKVADIKAGILTDQMNTPEITYAFLKHFISWARRKNASIARVNTWLPKYVDNKEIENSITIQRKLIHEGFKQITSPKHTYWIDLTLSEDQLLSNMKRQTRYDVRQAIKSDIYFEYHTEPNADIINTFIKLYTNLGDNKGFNTLSAKKIENEITMLSNAGLITIFVAKYDGIIVNISIASHVGKAQYLYGAINPIFKELKGCPSPGPAAQWEMITYAKKKGLKTYDMGFCPGPVPIPEHPKYPIWRFKYGFGGVPVEYLPQYSLVLNPVLGRVFNFINKHK